MRKNLQLIAAAACMLLGAATTTQAGGLLTNTNQNAAYVRQMSQNGIIDITGLYANPAGTAFLTNGWHLSLNSQTAKQQRNIETTFPLFAYNQKDNATTHRFEGEAFAPVIPSFSVSYNKDKWSVNAHFGLIGGGGKCEFDKGLGSFEALYAGKIYSQVANGVVAELAKGFIAQQLPVLMADGMTQEQAMAALEGPALQYGKDNYAALMPQVYQGYSLNAYMKGRSYYFGLQLGATYKFMDNLAGYVGLRGTYATCNYNGYVQDVRYTAKGETNDPKSDLTLNADQTGFGVAPIIGLDWKINDQWNVAAKYEAPTVMKLKNNSEMNEFALKEIADGNAVLGKFADGRKVREDIPGILALGVQYSPVSCVRISAGFNEYFDKAGKKTALDPATKQLADIKGAGIDKNTWEVNAGVEYDICKYVTISASYQSTNYGIADEGMSDLSFNLSNQMVGAGLRINATERCSIDLGYMHTIYGDRTVTTATEAGPKGDYYVRKNDVFGIGVNLAF